MKNSILIFSTLLIASFLTGCLSSGEKKENAEKEVVEANKMLEEANKAYLEDVKSYKTETEKIIEHNQERIADLRLQTAKEKESLRVENLRKIDELERQNNSLRNKLFDYRESNNSKWDNFKSEFNQDMNELKEAIAGFSSKND